MKLIKFKNGTITFTDKDEQFRYTVEDTFFKICDNPQEKTTTELFVEYNIQNYFHNLEGYAFECLLPGREKTKFYYIQGKVIHDDVTINGENLVEKINKKEIKSIDELGEEFKQIWESIPDTVVRDKK